MMKNQDNLLGVIDTIMRWRKPIGRVVLIATAGTALIAFLFLKNYYKSTTIFFAASPDIFKPEQMFGTSNKDMEYYGSEEDVDRIMTIAQSASLYEFLIKRFDLYKHYDIDSTKELAPFKVQEHLTKLYEVKKTKNNAIEISVEDLDKKFAADMARVAREKTDEIAQLMIRETQINLIKAYEMNIDEKNKTLYSIGDSLSRLRQSYGVIDPEKQTEAITKSAVDAEANFYRSRAKYDILKKNSIISNDTLAQLEATMMGYEEEMKKGGEMLKRYNLGFNSVSAMKEFYEQERNQLSRDKQRFLQLKIAYGTKISAIHLVEDARVPIMKSRPKRSIIIVSALLISLLFSVIGVLLIENYKNLSLQHANEAS
jgi:tyrosine-protein kinase Etk/Wzc